MNIILPVANDTDLKEKLADGFHNSEYICLYRTGTGTFQWIKTTDLSSSPGNLCMELKKKGVKAIISHDMPLMALSLFNEMGMQIYKANGFSLHNNIELFTAGMLKNYFSFTASVTSGCSTSCNSCNSSCS